MTPQTCDCASYNLPNGGRPEVALTPPPGIAMMRAVSHAPIMVDACIAPAVQAVWDAGHVTLGSCCGHGKQPPSLVLGEHEHDIDGVIATLDRVDGRSFELLQWRLIKLVSS